jgi:hypothetical protein
MNLDDPFVDLLDAAKPPAKASNTTAKFCEYCGSKGHLTQRSAKCTAKELVEKKFRKEDGALLSGNQTPLSCRWEQQWSLQPWMQQQSWQAVTAT